MIRPWCLSVSQTTTQRHARQNPVCSSMQMDHSQVISMCYVSVHIDCQFCFYGPQFVLSGSKWRRRRRVPLVHLFQALETEKIFGPDDYSPSLSLFFSSLSAGGNWQQQPSWCSKLSLLLQLVMSRIPLFSSPLACRGGKSFLLKFLSPVFSFGRFLVVFKIFK